MEVATASRSPELQRPQPATGPADEKEAAWGGGWESRGTSVSEREWEAVPAEGSSGWEELLSQKSDGWGSGSFEGALRVSTGTLASPRGRAAPDNRADNPDTQSDEAGLSKNLQSLTQPKPSARPLAYRPPLAAPKAAPPAAKAPLQEQPSEEGPDDFLQCLLGLGGSGARPSAAAAQARSESAKGSKRAGSATSVSSLGSESGKEGGGEDRKTAKSMPLPCPVCRQRTANFLSQHANPGGLAQGVCVPSAADKPKDELVTSTLPRVPALPSDKHGPGQGLPLLNSMSRTSPLRNAKE